MTESSLIVLGRVGEEGVDGSHDLGLLPADELPEAVHGVPLALVVVVQDAGRPLLLGHPHLGVARDVAHKLVRADTQGHGHRHEQRVHLIHGRARHRDRQIPSDPSIHPRWPNSPIDRNRTNNQMGNSNGVRTSGRIHRLDHEAYAEEAIFFFFFSSSSTAAWVYASVSRALQMRVRVEDGGGCVFIYRLRRRRAGAASWNSVSIG